VRGVTPGRLLTPIDLASRTKLWIRRVEKISGGFSQKCQGPVLTRQIIRYNPPSSTRHDYCLLQSKEKESETMKTNGETRLPYFLVGLSLGVVGGLISALLARKENRDRLRERSAKSLEYLNQQANKLRETTEEIVGKGKEMLSQRCCSSQATAGNGTQAAEEAKPEN
jgi:gas vesicle protein